MRKEDFYDVFEYGDRLEPGVELKIEHSITMEYDTPDLTPFTNSDVKELESLRKISAGTEQKIFDSLKEPLSKWERQAALTKLLDRAIQYLKMPEVEHTSNQWMHDDRSDRDKISNRVYQMSVSVYEDYKYDRQTRERNLGLFTVLYFVIGCCVAIPVGFVPIFLPILGALWSLITGIPFMLFLTRVKKFGMVTIMGILSGLLMGLTGMGFWGVPMGVIFGLLGDLILKSGGYKSAKKSLIGYAVFSLWMVGTYIPMYFMVEDSRASFAASFGEEYADRVMAVMPMWSIILVIAGIFIFAILGGLLGKALLKKHFAKAGIV